MEANPVESVRNNVLATRIVADVAAEFGAKRFVLISTDKALNPSAVYGQCKALCEWIVEAQGAREDVATRFVAVRFGNVLGSSGSVIPIFRRQIERGGPVTVTHPEMTRFFMTIPEAVSLVVQAGAIGAGGEIFVLDMGEPVKIVDLARKMIRLSGKEPERDDRDPLHRRAARREAARGAVGRGRDGRAGRAPEDHARDAADRRRRTGSTSELDELERLVEAGDTLEVVSRLGRTVREPHRAGTGSRPRTLRSGAPRSRAASNRAETVDAAGLGVEHSLKRRPLGYGPPGGRDRAAAGRWTGRAAREVQRCRRSRRRSAWCGRRRGPRRG